MSLLNLSRSITPVKTLKGQSVTAEQFINDALQYASGKVKAGPPSADTEKVHRAQMRKATFTLTEECIAQLQHLSEQSGLAKSKLIRLWIRHYDSIETR